MKIKSTRERLLASTMIVGALALAGTGHAMAQAVQTAPPTASTPTAPPGSTVTPPVAPDQAAGAATAGGPGATTSTVQEVVVTGSRISGVTNLTSASPVAVATHQDIVLQSSNTVEGVLDRLPNVDFNNGLSAASNNGGGGVSEISLRNLGPQRVLVLIDGQRVIPNGGSVDYNIIPLEMVDHVEVLKDGASSIYGADAIAGVVNIITRKNFEGVDVNANYGESSHGDGNEYGISATMGVKNDRGSLIIGAGWNVTDPIPQANRGWAVAQHQGDPNYPGGSNWRSQIGTLQNQDSPNEIWLGDANSSTPQSRTDCALASSIPATACIDGLLKLSSGAYATLTTGQDRKQLNFKGSYNITDNISFNLSGFYTHYDAEQLLRPEPLLGGLIATNVYSGFVVPASNPYNLTGQDITAYYTPNQFGPRTYDEANDTYRINAGLSGNFMNNFKWEAGYVYQESELKEIVRNEGNWQHLAELTGQSPCTPGDAVPGGCTANAAGVGVLNTPINFFNGPNIFTPAQIAYATFNNTSTEQARERYAYGDINGSLFQLPAGAVKGALGFELRDEDLFVNPDSLVQEGYGPNPSGPTAGGYHVASLYGEINVPILRDLPFVKSLDFDGSARYDHYSNFGGQVTYKVGGNWEVSRDVRFRGSYATAIRAPQVGELFGGQAVSDNNGGGDPCETSTDPTYKQNSNYGTGVIAAGTTCAAAAARAGKNYATFTDPIDAIPNNQIQTLIGGNPDLQPETARITTGGAIFTPRWTPGLSVAVDYYSIIISNTVLTGGISQATSNNYVLQQCYGPAQSQAFCNLVTRDATGAIFEINSLNANYGVNSAAGFDYEISYNTRTAHLDQYPVFNMIPGYFNFDVNVENEYKDTQTAPGGLTQQNAGFFNDGSGELTFPRWKGIFTVDYTLQRLHLRYDLRYTSRVFNVDGSPGVYGNEVPDLTYHDIAVSYDLPEIGPAQKSELIFGINNLTDKDPPFIGSDSTCKCNTIAGPFDVTGRYFYGRLSAHF